MPLSEDEQRRLDEIERALHHDDPKFAARQTIDRVWLRRTVAAATAVLIGMVLLVVGLITTQAVLVVGDRQYDGVSHHGRRRRIHHPPAAALNT